MSSGKVIERWVAAPAQNDPEWEAAYVQFETEHQEVAKFLRRLQRFGANAWDRNLLVVELFCGRGSALTAWHQLGFHCLEGVDLSATLLERYLGDARLYLGDCRDLKLPDASRDVICIQGGLHHLPALPEDLNSTVKEVRRVLRPGGRFLVVEPWATPYLRLVHWLGQETPLPRLYPKLEALEAMTTREKDTYQNWLSRPTEILRLLQENFETEFQRMAWGKLAWLGRKPASA